MIVKYLILYKVSVVYAGFIVNLFRNDNGSASGEKSTYWQLGTFSDTM